MKKTISSLLVVISFLSLAVGANAQTSDQKEIIPSNISADVRKELEKLLSSELSQRLEGAYNLGNIGEKAAPAIPFLLEVLQRYEGMVEVEKGSLKYFEKDAAFMVFGGNANTINPVQMVASVALAKIGKPAIEPLRTALLKADPTELPFASIAEALARMQDPATTKMLCGMLSSENRHTRSRIVGALAYSKDPSSIDVLIEALRDKESSVRSRAARSLKRITGQDFGEDAGKWQGWSTWLQEKKPSPSENARQPALNVIAAWVPKRIVVNRNEVSPGDGHMFLAVQAMPKGVKDLRGLHQAYFDKDMNIIGIETRIEGWGSMSSGDVALTDSGGNRYNPIGCISSRFVFFQSKTMMTDIFQLTAPDGQSVVGEALVYLYEVPKGRGGFKLTVRDSQPIPVEVKTQ